MRGTVTVEEFYNLYEALDFEFKWISPLACKTFPLSSSHLSVLFKYVPNATLVKIRLFNIALCKMIQCTYVYLIVTVVSLIIAAMVVIANTLFLILYTAIKGMNS